MCHDLVLVRLERPHRWNHSIALEVLSVSIEYELVWGGGGGGGGVEIQVVKFVVTKLNSTAQISSVAKWPLFLWAEKERLRNNTVIMQFSLLATQCAGSERLNQFVLSNALETIDICILCCCINVSMLQIYWGFTIDHNTRLFMTIA